MANAGQVTNNLPRSQQRPLHKDPKGINSVCASELVRSVVQTALNDCVVSGSRVGHVLVMHVLGGCMRQAGRQQRTWLTCASRCPSRTAASWEAACCCATTTLGRTARPQSLRRQSPPGAACSAAVDTPPSPLQAAPASTPEEHVRQAAGWAIHIKSSLLKGQLWRAAQNKPRCSWRVFELKASFAATSMEAPGC